MNKSYYWIKLKLLKKSMNPTDILLSIAIVGIYTLIYVYLKSKYDDNKIIIKLFVVGFVYATIITGILYYLIKFIAS